ncbi:MAG: D-alanyl-D-alanine carboxypeptidase/D-alanyl-D-alanine endopeptidase [Planctomycetota bacterium]|jgi:D-alanyl-D-alanine carboxypeptidase/D-alanyl-D-alanine-endopeptidase (penicillin-binding protein 4)
MRLKAKNNLFILIFIFTVVNSVFADLANSIQKIIRQPSQKKAVYSIHITEASTGKSVFNHNANLSLVPASNMKIITSAAALKYLGADYKFKTIVGLYKNTLVIKGGGDPLLGDEKTDSTYGRAPNWIFKDIARKLRQKGITTIKDIIVDSTIFDDQRVHPSWPKEQLNQWYACEVSGLNFNGNCINITAKNIGSMAVVTTYPQTRFLTIVNQITPIKKGKGAIGAYRNQQPNKIILKGKCRSQQGPFSVAIERPAAFFGYVLAEQLIAEGISTEGQLIEQAFNKSDNFIKVAEFVTPISDCLDRCNKDSLGLIAECFMKAIAAKADRNGKNGSWQGAREVISMYFSALGINSNEFNIDDGSGLSKRNKLSANTITKVLLDVYRSPYWQVYRDSLAIGGIDGTIKKYFWEKQYKGRICGKTGYIAGAKSFSGICSTAKGDYIFSILANKTNAKTRPVINNIAKAIIDNYADK